MYGEKTCNNRYQNRCCFFNGKYRFETLTVQKVVLNKYIPEVCGFCRVQS